MARLQSDEENLKAAYDYDDVIELFLFALCICILTEKDNGVRIIFLDPTLPH